MFHKLFLSVKTNVLNDWLNIKDVMKLNTATTSKDREQFLRLLPFLKNVECGNLKQLSYFHKHNIPIYSIINFFSMIDYIRVYPDVIRNTKKIYSNQPSLKYFVDNNDCLEDITLVESKSSLIFGKYTPKCLLLFRSEQLFHFNISNLTKLRMLEQERIKYGPEIIDYIIEKCPNLISIDVPCDYNEMNKIIKSYPNLEELSFYDTCNIKPNQLSKIKKIEIIHARIDNVLWNFMNSCKLTGLTLIKCIINTTYRLDEYIIFQVNLKFLNIQEMRFSYKDSIKTIIMCKKLEQVILTPINNWGSYRNSTEIINDIGWIDELPLLQKVTIYCCVNKPISLKHNDFNFKSDRGSLSIVRK